jgi:hypothetical protein
MPSEYTQLPWIRRTEVVTDGETMFVKVWFQESDDIVVVPTGEFHRFCHRSVDWSYAVDAQEVDLENELHEAVGEIGSAL